MDNALEKALREVVAEVTRSEVNSLRTELKYMGLSSIGTIRLSTRLFKHFHVEIPAKSLLDATLATLEDAIIEAWMAGDAAREHEAEAALTAVEPFPLSAAQMGIYVDCMRQPESTAYNIPSALIFDRALDPKKLIGAVRAVMAAHPSIHVHFELREDQAYAVPNAEAVPEIPVHALPEAELDAFKSHFVRPFHLKQGPLYRFAIAQTEANTILCADFHHLVFDGFSYDLFLRDLNAALRHEAVETEGRSYAAFVRDQRASLEGNAAENDAYLSALFADYEAPSELTPDISGNHDNGKKAYAVAPLDAELLQRACERSGISEAALMLGAVAYTAARLTASDRVYISTISSGRGDVRFSDTFGMFVNTLPLSIGLNDGTIDDYLRDAAAGLNAAIAHENIPFAEIAGKWGFAPKLMYEYQRGVVEKKALPWLDHMEAMESDQAKFPMTVRIEDLDGRSAISVEYDDSLYSPTLMDAFATSCAIVGRTFARSGRRRLRSVSLLDEDRRRVIEGFRFTPDDTIIPEGTLYHHGLERYARETPDRLALVACDASYTYREMDAMANRIANALIRRGVTPGSRVLLLLPRTSRVLLTLFGALKAGAAYIPCDPNYPTERVRHILEDAEASIVVTTADRLDRFTDNRAVDVEELLQEENSAKPDVRVTPEDLAYLIYTSGSTGKPKGVMLRHCGAVQYMTDAPANILVHAMASDGHVMTGVTTLSFDMSVKEFGITLFNGLTIVLADENQCNDAGALAKRMLETHTDMFQATPSRLLTLMASQEFCHALADCRIIICAGEKYPDHLLHTLQNLCPNARIFNTYGPTEITVSSNIRELTNDSRVTVGHPLLGVTEFIVDSDGNELPAGVTGELYIGGKGVAVGYKGLPDMTAERFIEYQGIRVYKSGDYARWTADGNVEILGRTDNQVKLRGLRIEIGEVESVLTEQPGITRAAVKIQAIRGIDHLCAYFTADHAVDIGELKHSLARVLTNYMVPTAYMQLDAMPLTPNGKLDLKRLPEAQIFRATSDEKVANAAERALCEIFSQLLRVEDVGPEESFFELGGTSLLVTNVVIEANKRGLALAFGDVFAHPTPRALAQRLGAGAAESDTTGKDKKDHEITDYDYTAIEALLANNNLVSFMQGEKRELGDVLLTGATGYLGIHILHELLEKEQGKIYCLLRGTKNVNARKRLLSSLFYYFGNTYVELIGQRLFILEGDVTQTVALEGFAPGSVQTVINCAAVVKHFSEGTLIEDVNVNGALNLIEFCLRTGATLIQTSTMSTVSSILKANLSQNFAAREQHLYFDQLLENKYVHSKFIAERAVLEAVATRGLQAKIMRLGNLAPRYSDGEFQMNYEGNSAMGRLRAFATLGVCAYDQLDNPMEFSPIDAVAQAIVALSRTPRQCTVFHPFNHQQLLMGIVFNEMTALGLTVQPVEREKFQQVFRQVQNDPEKARFLTPIMAYMSAPGKDEAVFLPRHNEYTMQVLYRLGFRWPITTWDYVRRFLEGMKGFGYFEARM